MNYTRYLTLAGMIAAAGLARLLPHPWNFTPVGAMALFGGAQFGRRYTAFLVPFAALILGDLGSGPHKMMPFVYPCFALNVCLGFWVRRRAGAGRIIIAAVVSSTMFFLITNFAVWTALGTYPKNARGLIACYVAGLPLYRNGLLGDLFYSGVLFGGLALAGARFDCLREMRPEPVSAGSL